MKGYYIEDFSDEQTYFAFIHYMLAHSDYFSLLYFRYRENEKLRKIPQEIKKGLAAMKKKAPSLHRISSLFSLEVISL